jgi:hypothetical protein
MVFIRLLDNPCHLRRGKQRSEIREQVNEANAQPAYARLPPSLKLQRDRSAWRALTCLAEATAKEEHPMKNGDVRGQKLKA